jgi:hypothetical protein
MTALIHRQAEASNRAVAAAQARRAVDRFLALTAGAGPPGR